MLLPDSNPRKNSNVVLVVEMSSQGELLKQISTILAEARAQGYKIQDIMPEGVPNRFHGMKEQEAAQ